ncbi:restriction endonuclease subunit S [Chryseobacterium sp. T20]|uniref:restriction endonuclease subunit S n=1 Tax=Chryseobacterium sp. T20 TaxID=3395375 RepID=UPI0039BC9A83
MIKGTVYNLEEILVESKLEVKVANPQKRIRVKLNLGGVEKRPELKEKEGATKYFVRKAGQFIYGKQNLHKGAFGIIPNELDGYESSGDLPAFDVLDKCLPEWIFYFFIQNNLYVKLEILAKGIGSKRIQPSQLFKLKINIPEKEYQRRLIDKIKVLESDIQRIKAELNKQLEIAANLKQSFLMEAFSGLHTKNWREKNGYLGSSSENISLDDSHFSIPSTWEEKLIGEYVICERGRFSARPRNDPKFFNGKIPFIQIGDLPNDGGFIRNHNQTLNEAGLKVSKLFPVGTIVIAIVGATIGNTGILTYETAFPDSMIGIKPQNHFDSHYLEYYLRFNKDNLRTLSYSGGGQPNIKLATINSIKINVPPLEEQRIISAKISKVFSSIEQFESEVRQSFIALEKLFSAEISKYWFDNKIMVNMANNQSSVSFFKEIEKADKKFINDETNTEILELLKTHGKMPALTVLRQSKFKDNIDDFYTNIKYLIEEIKVIKESEKGYLELI